MQLCAIVVCAFVGNCFRHKYGERLHEQFCFAPWFVQFASAKCIFPASMHKLLFSSTTFLWNYENLVSETLKNIVKFKKKYYYFLLKLRVQLLEVIIFEKVVFLLNPSIHFIIWDKSVRILTFQHIFK